MTNATLETIRLVFEILANIATLLGVPIAIWLFANEKRRERLDREYGTYDALDEKYIDYLKLCLEYPDLDVYDYAMRENFRLAWKILGTQFDANCLQYMDRVMLETKVNEQMSDQNEE